MPESLVYPLKVREKARRLFLLGYTVTAICSLQGMPDRSTIRDWRYKEDWDADIPKIQERVREKRIENIATEIAKMDAEQLALLRKMRKKIADHLKLDGLLGAKDLQALSLALDKAIKNERLIKGKVTDIQESNVKIGWEDIIYGTTEVPIPPNPKRKVKP